MKTKTKESIFMGIAGALIISVILGLAGGYGHLIYGDWKCGMPGVHCRLMKGDR